MFASLSLGWLAAIFIGAIAIVWIAGGWLSDSTDALASRFHMGQALGGILLLAISTNLPEVAITASAALHRHTANVGYGVLVEDGSGPRGTGTPKSGVPSGFQVKGWARVVRWA